MNERSYIVTKRLHEAQRLLGACRIWGITATVAFVLVVILTGIVYYQKSVDTWILFFVLLAGFSCIGATSLFRHTFVNLKHLIGKSVSAAEFLSTQFIFVLFPFYYARLKDEVKQYKKTGEG